MRLLNRSDNGDLNFTKDLVGGNTIPAYAILSHTWDEDKEVTYDDWMNGQAKSKAGYNKIEFCAQQAERDGFSHFWIDTCCINKADRVELCEAISSMFRWYQNAAKCYVLLSDVSTSKQRADNENLDSPWLPAFRASRWFTRGWTLQELLAPNSVEFFSKEWRKLGDKVSLMQHICERTRIPSLALQGALSHFSVNERMSWSEHRQTKLPQDRAYSLMGILGVYISPFEGEGTEGAFKRLIDEVEKLSNCLRDLHVTDPRDDKIRIEETKGGLFKDSYRWVLSNAGFQKWYNDPQSRLLWIKGDPGKGKTMLLCGIINELEKPMAATRLLSYFFCQATDLRINSATAVLRGLMYMLIHQQPLLASHLQKKLDRAGSALFKNANTWVAMAQIFTDILQDSSLKRTYLVVDALDECIVDRLKLLDFIKHSSAISSAKWIVSSRNWPDIEEQLEQSERKVRINLELNAESVSAAVQTFIAEKVCALTQKKNLSESTRKAVLSYLTANANDTFLWVALVCQMLDRTSKRNVLKKLDAFPPGLESLYEQMMQQISHSEDKELCKHVLAIVTVVYRPIRLEELAVLAKQLEDIADDLDSIREVIGICGSFLTLREGIVYFVHQSARDFLAKATTEVFPYDQRDVHHAVYTQSLKILSQTLRRDIYGLKQLGFPVKDIVPPDPDPLAASRYSCIYWVDHLCASRSVTSPAIYANDDLQDGGPIDTFLREKYLYWLEALSICKSTPQGVLSMAKLQSLVQGRDSSSFAEFVYDAYRFVMYHRGAIETAPLQAYASALLFSPTGSLVKRQFQHEEPKNITINLDVGDDWTACLQTLKDYSGAVTSVVFLHSTWLASASEDETIKIWDTSSGACLQTFTGHDDWVSSVASPHDSKQSILASASHDRTVKIWDISSGICLKTLTGHTKEVTSVVFSQNSTPLVLVSASRDETVKIWDVGSGVCLKTHDHSYPVTSVAFLHNSAWLSTSSEDGTIKIWDTSSGICLKTLTGHTEEVTSMAFAHNLTPPMLASASKDETFKIWDTDSGVCLKTFAYDYYLTSVAFSHSSTWLAVGLEDSTVIIYDTSSWMCVTILTGHIYAVLSVAFSHDSNQLASASEDCTVKIWDIQMQPPSPRMPDSVRIDPPTFFKGHEMWVDFVVFSHDSTWLASNSQDGIMIWDSSSGALLHTITGLQHLTRVSSSTFSHDLNWLASGDSDGKIKIWDISFLSTSPTNSILSTSPASSIISNSPTDSVSCEEELCFQELNHEVSRMVFSHDLNWLASGDRGGKMKIWNVSMLPTSPISSMISSSSTSSASIEEERYTLEGHTGEVTSMAFSPGSTILASASQDDKTVKLWSTSSWLCLRTVNVGYSTSLSFDPTGSYLYTQARIIDLNTWPVSNKADLAELPHSQHPEAGTDIDSSWITYDGENILWVPSDYHATAIDACRGKVAFARLSKGIWTCEIEPDQAHG